MLFILDRLRLGQPKILETVPDASRDVFGKSRNHENIQRSMLMERWASEDWSWANLQ
jgi:hypothetical protein